MKNPRINKSLNREIKKYNSTLPELPGNIKSLQKRMLQGSGWTPDSGPFEGVFDQLGVLWNCVWQTSGGAIGPNQYWPIPYIPAEAFIFEHLENASIETRIGQTRGNAEKYLEFMLDLRSLESGFGSISSFMQKYQHQLPRGNREFLCAFDPPSLDRIIIPRYRPGWPTRTSMLKPIEKKIDPRLLAQEGERYMP